MLKGPKVEPTGEERGMVGGSKALGIHLKYGEPSASGAACMQIRADLVHPTLVFVPHIAPTTEPVARLVCSSALSGAPLPRIRAP